MLARLCAPILTITLVLLNAANCGGEAKAEVKKNGIWVEVAYLEFTGSNKDVDAFFKELENNPRKVPKMPGITPIRYGFLIPGEKQSYQSEVKIATGVLRLEFKYIEIKDKGVECLRTSRVARWGPNLPQNALGRPYCTESYSRRFYEYNKQYAAPAGALGGRHHMFIIRLLPRPPASS